jgi:hypothetical protein
MNQRLLCLSVALMLCLPALLAQSWTAYLSANELFPLGNELKGQHPILWSSKAQGKVVVGGFGLGVAHTRPWQKKASLRFQASAQRSRFYDIPVIVTDANGFQPIAAIGVNTHYHLSLLAMPWWALTPAGRFAAGIGPGLRGSFLSRTNYGEVFVNGIPTDLKLPNKSLAPLALFIAPAVQAELGRFSIGTRAELALTPVNRVPAYRRERSLVWVWELGYRIRE